MKLYFKVSKNCPIIQGKKSLRNTMPYKHRLQYSYAWQCYDNLPFQTYVFFFFFCMSIMQPSCKSNYNLQFKRGFLLPHRFTIATCAPGVLMDISWGLQTSFCNMYAAFMISIP